MILSKLTLNNFRSHKNSEFQFSPGVNVIYGENGTGKTNILESIHFLATAKSHRTNHEKEMVRMDETVASIQAEFSARNRENEIVSFLSNTGKKQFRKNDVPIHKTSDLMGFISVVLFSPDDLVIIKGSPSARRRMLDLAICQMSKKYFHLLSSYNRVLSQKNKFLKMCDPFSDLSQSLAIWNEQLAVYGSQIATFRHEYIEKLRVFASSRFSEIMNGLTLNIEYLPSGESAEPPSAEQLLKQINRNIKKETTQRLSVIGMHRDDFLTTIDGKEAKLYSSQGQQRSAVISMKTAQVEILKDRLGESPILLLDDVMSELDKTRQSHILSPKHDVQTIITTTKKPHGLAKCIFLPS